MIKKMLLVSPVDPFEFGGTPRVTHYSELYLRKYCEKLTVFNYRKSTFSSKLHLAKFYVPGFQKWDIRRMNRRLLELVNNQHFNIILLFKGEDLFPETIKEISEKNGVIIAAWMADDPFSFKNIKKSLMYYNYYFIWDSWYLMPLRDAGVKNVVYLPPYTIPEVYRKIDLTEEEKEQFVSDLVFVGTWRPDREKILGKLLDFDIKIYGNGWQNNSKLPKKYVNREVNIIEMNKIYNASKIVLNVHHSWGKNDANFRTFEALGSGGFLIDERKKDIISLFKENEEIVLYESIDELREKIEHFLGDEDSRKRIARKGSEIVNKEHTVSKRCDELFTWLKSY